MPGSLVVSLPNLVHVPICVCLLLGLGLPSKLDVGVVVGDKQNFHIHQEWYRRSSWSGEHRTTFRSHVQCWTIVKVTHVCDSCTHTFCVLYECVLILQNLVATILRLDFEGGIQAMPVCAHSFNTHITKTVAWHLHIMHVNIIYHGWPYVYVTFMGWIVLTCAASFWMQDHLRHAWWDF